MKSSKPMLKQAAQPTVPQTGISVNWKQQSAKDPILLPPSLKLPLLANLTLMNKSKMAAAD